MEDESFFIVKKSKVLAWNMNLAYFVLSESIPF
ncbi:hypothetical protein SCACP_04170 [Sporomusa carbonis]